MRFYVETKVTKATETELKLSAHWPLAWRQVPKAMTIQRALNPSEVWQAPDYGQTQFAELAYVPRSAWPNLKLGDHVEVICE